jgi:ABC-2 type transport system ATP-binding protein
MKAIEIKNVTKRFGDKLVIDNVSLDIEKGEIFGLLGPNGAGKSTLINLTVGLLKIDKGEILIDGYNIAKEDLKAKAEIGLVPQEIALFESLNAKENLEYWGGLYGLHGKLLKDRIDEALEIAALTEHAKKPIKNYSGGMKRRLNIAAAMMHHPEILIMDEPTVGVDPQSRNHIFEVVKKMNRDFNSTVVYTSHYMEEVETLCHRIMILDEGKNIALGTKEELKRMVSSDKVIKIKARGDIESLMFSIKKMPNVRSAAIQDDELKIIANEKITLNDILSDITNHNVVVKNIGIEEPTLEEVFLTLTGKRLRDKEE